MDVPANHQELTPLARLRAKIKGIAQHRRLQQAGASAAVLAQQSAVKKSAPGNGVAVNAAADPAELKPIAPLAAPPDPSGIVTLAPLTYAAGQYLGEADLRRLREAYRLADSAHLGQFRSSGEPYISHPLAVSQICAGWKLDTEALMAALLHDVMEDSQIGKQELIERFGIGVADLVDGLSKLDRLEFASREHAQAESFRKMLLAMARDVRVILIKLADRLHNMRTLGAIDAKRRQRIARETLDIYVPIANRLGLHAVYLELIDLSFAHRFPWRANVLQQAMKAARGNQRELVGKIIESVKRKLPEMGVTAEITGREKTLFGIYEKMAEKRMSFSQVLDIYGFRLVVDDVASCYVALGALHATFKPVPGRFKDYVAIPKVNGYQSLHTTLIGPFGTPIEFQIRTREMNRVAEDGVAAHWLYKAEGESFTDLQKRTHQWLQSLLDIQHQTRDSLEFFEHVKVDLFPDAVYVFSPKGRIHALPRGATIVDFAYAIHTEIGNHAIEGRVNQNVVPLRTELQNGDIVEVITDPLAAPSASWLSFVQTGKARSGIRHFLKTIQFDESVGLGRNMLAQSLASIGIDITGIDPELLARAAKEAGAPSLESLHADIGLGRALAPVVARTISIWKALRADQPQHARRAMPVILEGREGMAVQFASCCSPVPGDGIVGHMRGGHGLAVHRDDCSTLARQKAKDPERWIAVEWPDPPQGLYRSRIEVYSRNEAGTLGRIASEISASGSNIAHVTMDDDAHAHAFLRFVVQVRDRTHLAKVLRHMRRVPQVVKITRI
jgi:GTP pyrophosphokinase